MGLRFPDDLAAWHRWQNSRHLARNTARRLLKGADSAPLTAWLATNSDETPRLAVVLESRAASSHMAVVEPLAHLLDVPTVVVASFDPTDRLRGGPWRTIEVDSFTPADHVGGVRAVVSAADYLPLGAAMFAEANRRGITWATVQHGLLTPSAPPLPRGQHLLAWTESDASFWLSGRTDSAVTVVGSQLLARAASTPRAPVSRFERPLYLGQLHGAELSRVGMTRAITSLWRETGARYRPHPSETDAVSRLQHRAWERLGMEIDRSGTPLASAGAPVVSAFSTGVLEAAAQGVPAWVYYPDPPAWLEEFWDRYALNRWGSSPTPPPALPADEPAARVAAWVRQQVGPQPEATTLR